MNDPTSAIYLHHNLVWYQCKLFRDLWFGITLRATENCYIFQDFQNRPFKSARIFLKNFKSAHHSMINAVLLDIYRLARQIKNTCAHVTYVENIEKSKIKIQWPIDPHPY